MNSSKQRLKPLNPLSQKRPSNQDTILLKTSEKKPTSTISQSKNNETEAQYKKIKYVKTGKASTKTIELYDCDDLDEMPGIE